MTWPARIGMGVAVLAALAVGRTIDTALPTSADVRPFVHAAGVGDTVHLVYADVTVDAVRTAKTLHTEQQGAVSTPGRWLVVDVTVVAWGRPLSNPAISLDDATGRRFLSDSRSGYSVIHAPTGVPWRARVPFEVPEDALQGATLVFSRTALDDRRDDVARIDLGIGAGEVARLWDTQDTIESPRPTRGHCELMASAQPMGSPRAACHGGPRRRRERPARTRLLVGPRSAACCCDRRPGRVGDVVRLLHRRHR
jgi:hypothetical protein